MALVLKDRVKETTTTTSTGTYTLAGAAPGYQAFSVIGDGSITYYAVTNGTDWEVGIGTYTSSGTTLSRDTILESSNSGNAVNWGAGAKDVFVTYPAEKSSVSYTATRTANYTAGANEGVPTNTTGGAFTVTLPASPITGIQVVVMDMAGNWGANNLTVARNGSTIEGLSEDLTCNISDASVQFVYTGSTWNVYTQLGGNGGALVTLAGVETLTNKTIDGANNTLTVRLANDVTGTLPVANGGTGQTSYTDGQLLIGNSVGNTLTKATLTAGTGITITNGNGSITVASPNTGTVTSVVAGTGLSGGTITTSGTIAVNTNGITNSLFRQSSALSVVGRSSNTTGDVADIAAGTDNQVLRRSGTAIGFGSVNLASTDAVTGTLPVGNGGTGSTTSTGSGAVVLATSPTLVTPALGTPASGILSNCTVDGTDAVGFRNTPVNSRSADYTLVLADSGKTILHAIADDNPRTFTIPAESSVNYPIGTFINFTNLKNTVTIAITTDTMYLANAGTTGSRTLAVWGVATAVKVASATWIISGTGLT